MAIYYFSGTGNCLVVARRIAAQIGCKSVPIAETLDASTIRTDAESVGIVFPAYLAALHGVPLIVEDFVCRFEDLDKKHVFAVCTCGGYEIVNAVPALRRLSKLVERKGARLFGEYSVRLPMNNLDYEHIPVPIETDTMTIIRSAKMQVEDICNRIACHRREKRHVLRRLFTVMMIPVYSMMAKTCMKSLRELAGKPKDVALGFRDLVPFTDMSITVDDCCTGCETCVKVCPVGNIELVNKKPTWRHRCEMCFACDEWCPSGAIRHWGRSGGVKYHHPEVGLRDMMR